MLEFRETYESSFPCRRESGISMPQEFIGKNQNPSAVIPTFVGMTGCRFVGMTWCRFPCGWIRHSRAGGNPVRSVSVISDKFLLLFISRFPLPWE
ncbi:hypothetical protein E5O75_12120 [Neisseria gonorrhoeae]|nr:hypothetical protein EGH17_00475 [Neisseria gonorrhoeae]EEZ42863.1 conserved hypothetical protein [Neisseria gonorrhoeae 35/02]ROU24310.1 hypothetical protein EGO69_11890 [Neisseria gonorrhoeae]ROU27313.1 hypothetical protein EGO62_11880 [Neisseria gonorrhoeae]ROU27863.1 hypothetical protein EGO68_11855 [Neisseria gonorrhoeae]